MTKFAVRQRKNNKARNMEESISGVLEVKFSCRKISNMGMNKAIFVVYATVAHALASLVSLNVATPPNNLATPNVQRLPKNQATAPSMGPITMDKSRITGIEVVSPASRFIACSRHKVIPNSEINTNNNFVDVSSIACRMVFFGCFMS